MTNFITSDNSHLSDPKMQTKPGKREGQSGPIQPGQSPPIGDDQSSPIGDDQSSPIGDDQSSPIGVDPYKGIEEGIEGGSISPAAPGDVTEISMEEDTHEIDFIVLSQLSRREIDFTTSDHDQTKSSRVPQVPDEAVARYLRNAISENTIRAYRADIEHFEAWGGTIPADPGTVAKYLAAQAGRLAVSTVRRRVAAISAVHESKGFPNPTHTKLVKAALRGIQRAHGAPQDRASPLLVEDLTRIVGLMGEDSKSIRDKALLLIGFAGGFRRSELVGLNRADIEIARQGVIITLRRSKTDQTGTGRKVGIPHARGRHCPVRYLEAWLRRLPDDESPIFRPVTKSAQIGATRLSSEAVSRIVKRAVEIIGFESDRYSGHSLRAGLATSAAMHGISTLSIRRQTGHASDSMLARYVRTGELFVNNAAGLLL